VLFFAKKSFYPLVILGELLGNPWVKIGGGQETERCVVRFKDLQQTENRARKIIKAHQVLAYIKLFL